MGYSDDEKVQVKMAFLRMMVKMELNPADARFINGFFEQYLKLNEEEETILMQEINRSENAEELITLSNFWEERGIRKGLEQGVAEAKKEIVLKMLKEGLSTDIITKITNFDKEAIDQLRSLI